MRAKAEICLQRPRDEEKYRLTLRQILEELERISRRIEDLMLLSRADSGQAVVRTRPLNLNKSVEDACCEAQPLAETFDIKFGFELSDQDIAIQGDDEAIPRLLLILIDNALKYTRPGGRVRVTLRAAGDGFALAEVSDTGIGIAEKDLPHIFERFYRADRARSRKEGGAGLGLAIARMIAEAHHGAIDVRSTHEHGSTFTVRLPILADPEPGADPSDYAGRGMLSAPRSSGTAV
jgi:signal transduction histidine kinase